MPIVSTIKMTAGQFLELGKDPAGVRLELVDGEVAVSPSPVPDHSFVVQTLSRILGNHIEAGSLGALFADVDTVLGDHFVRRPDIIYFSKDRLHLVGEKAMEGPPDLCVEVLSPGSIDIDRVDKFEEYREFGVPNYWIVDPVLRTIEAFVLKRKKYVPAGRGQGKDLVRLQPFADLEIDLGRLWWRKR